MRYKIIADLIVVIHLFWIVFMVWGFLLTLKASVCLYILKRNVENSLRFFDRYIFRTAHLGGIVFVALLVLLNTYCPLTIAENLLLRRYNPSLTYPGSFIIHYVEKIVYPDVDPSILYTATLIVALFTLIMFILKPPKAFL